MFESIIISLVSSGFFFTAIVLLMDRHHASKRHRGDVSDHFDGRQFFNISWRTGETFRLTETEEEFFGGKRKNGFLSFYKWILNQKISLWKKREITPVSPVARHKSKTTQVTYIGHATVLIQTQGINMLTDPVWSKRASPVQWAGPKRYTDPGVTLDDLPPLDAVLLSHNHYDHMDLVALRFLSKKHHMPIYTGLGNKEYLKARGINNVIEMDWWDRELLGDCKITFVPSQHFSARGITDRNRTLWGGFAWQIGEATGYFAGDTGYGPFIENIQERFPDGFDIGLLPIGAYNPRWFMASMHTSPYEGMQMQKDLGIRKAIGIHYGTFPLAADLQDEPLEDLAIAKLDPLFAGQDFRAGESGTVWEL
ncbi:MBL fold metallo-hydrolase [Candidatus Gracilibacteria bacterium]|nr:MBL fold metallo-hydrolase [Candidatus Gracilibacteria bacterium]